MGFVLIYRVYFNNGINSKKSITQYQGNRKNDIIVMDFI